MAITPFTQPVQQSEFIPQKPKLPTEAISGAAQRIEDIHLRRAKQRDKILGTAVKQQAHPRDRQALEQFEQNLRGEFERLAEDDLLFGDQEEISRLARMTEEELQKIQRAKKLRESQQKQIENLSDAGRQQAAKQITRSQGLQFDKETGRIDTSSFPSVTSFAEEADNLYDIGVDAIEGLKETFDRKRSGFAGTYEDMGLARFQEVSGVSDKRIKRAVDNEFANNSEVQNWKSNSIKLLRNKYLMEGMSEEKATDQAQKTVNTKLDTLATQIANNRASNDVNINLRSLPGSGDDGEGGTKEIVVPGSPISFDHLPEGPYKDEYKDRRNRIETKIMQKNFSDAELEKIRNLRQRAKRLSERTPERGSGKTTIGPTTEQEFFTQRQYSTEDREQQPPRTEQEFLTQMMSGQTPQIRTEDAYFAQLMQNAEVNGEKTNLLDRYQTVQENIREKAQTPESAPNFYTPSGSQTKMSQKMDQMATAVQNMAGKLKSQDILVQSEEDNSWIPFYGGAQTKENTAQTFRDVLSNTKNVSVSGDGRWIKITTDNSIEGDDENRLEGRSFRIPTQNMTSSMIKPLTDMFSDEAQQVIESNLKYRNATITSDNPLEVGNQYRVNVSGNIDPETNQWQEDYILQKKGENGEVQPVVYDDLISTANSSEEMTNRIVQAAKTENLRGIRNKEDAIAALKNYKNHQKHGESLNVYGRQLKQLLENTTVSADHRGLAVEAAVQLQRSTEPNNE